MAEENLFNNPIGWFLGAFLIMTILVVIITGINQSINAAQCVDYTDTTFYNVSTEICQEPTNASATNTPSMTATERTIYRIPILLMVASIFIGLAILFGIMKKK